MFPEVTTRGLNCYKKIYFFSVLFFQQKTYTVHTDCHIKRPFKCFVMQWGPKHLAKSGVQRLFSKQKNFCKTTWSLVASSGDTGQDYVP